MPFPNPETQFQPGESGNPAGKPKGTKHLSTHIQEMLNDEKFELKLKSGEIIKQRPINAIIKTAIAKSISGDTRAMEWLAKHGYGEKVNLELSGSMNVALVEFLDDKVLPITNSSSNDDADKDQSPNTD